MNLDRHESVIDRDFELEECKLEELYGEYAAKYIGNTRFGMMKRIVYICLRLLHLICLMNFRTYGQGLK